MIERIDSEKLLAILIEVFSNPAGSPASLLEADLPQLLARLKNGQTSSDQVQSTSADERQQ